jgi:hypothetical protein
MASIAELNKTKAELRGKIQDYIRMRLGDGMVDVELDTEHYNMAIDKAVMRYRQRSQNSQEESYAFLPLVGETQSYTLPNEILQVRQIFRRGLGTTTGSTGSQFEPFASGVLNTYFLVNGQVGGLTNYELYAEYQELAVRMFGGNMNYTFNTVSKQLTVVRKIPNTGISADGSTENVSETVLLWVFNYKPEISLLQDYLIFPWIQEYAFAIAKMTLGEAREKFATIAGPSGGTTLNGTALKSEAKESIDNLEEELKLYVDGSQPLSFIIG